LKNSDLKKCPSTHHVSPAVHHNFTTKNHVKNTHFLENPLQKRPPPRNKKTQT